MSYDQALQYAKNYNKGLVWDMPIVIMSSNTEVMLIAILIWGDGN